MQVGTVTKMAEIKLTGHEADVVRDFIEMNLVPNIKNDELDIDSLWWIETIIKVWRKCGGKYADEDGDGA